MASFLKKFKNPFKKNKKQKEADILVGPSPFGDDYLEDNAEFKIEDLKIEEEEQKEKEENLSKVVCDFSKLDDGFFSFSAQEIAQMVSQFKVMPSNAMDEFRSQSAYKKGGMVHVDKQMVARQRKFWKQTVLDVGKQILTGKVNLTKVSFPIKNMIPRTMLNSAVTNSCISPIIMTKAAQQQDKLQRFKMVVASALAVNIYTTTFLKPLNPVLGETLHGSYKDGTQCYAEQISHHPPISYFLIIGPNKNYIYSGYYQCSAKAGLNSLTAYNTGKRQILFHDGQKIEFSFINEHYASTFIGTLRQETFGTLNFADEENQIFAEVEVGKTKGKPSDYFSGEIQMNDKIISQVNGTILGFVDIGNERFWDYRMLKPILMDIGNYGLEPGQALESDWQNRNDLKELKAYNVKQADIEKVKIEEKQRYDANLRKKVQKEEEKLQQKQQGGGGGIFGFFKK